VAAKERESAGENQIRVYSRKFAANQFQKGTCMLLRSAVLCFVVSLMTSVAAPRAVSHGSWNGQPASTTKSGAVPIDLQDNRVFINLTVARADGSLRKVRFQVDTGGGAMILSESLENDLGLKHSGPVVNDKGKRVQMVIAPKVRIDAMPLDLTGVPVIVPVGSKGEFTPGSGAEGFLPARVLRKYDVVFDYPAREFTMAQPGVLQHRRTAVPSPIGEKSGFPRIELTVDGEKYAFLLDTGAAFTMVSETVLAKWRAAHPEWPHCTGAAGAANMIGGSFDAQAEMVRVPQMQWGTLDLHGTGIVSRPAGIFEKWMTSMMPSPIVGAIAGNVLRTFRVEIDYAHSVTYLEQHSNGDVHDVDAVGLVVGARPDGSYIIGGVVKRDGQDTVQGVEAGDKLVRIGSWQVQGATLADVLSALRGRPGERKTISLDRGGKEVTVETTIAALL
jgi:hypothetical protein